MRGHYPLRKKRDALDDAGEGELDINDCRIAFAAALAWRNHAAIGNRSLNKMSRLPCQPQSMTAMRRLSAGQNDVFFCPGVDLAAMRAGEFGCLDLRFGPELFFDGLTGRGEFRGGRAPHEQAFNDWSVS